MAFIVCPADVPTTESTTETWPAPPPTPVLCTIRSPCTGTYAVPFACLSAWLVLFGSKFVILEALSLAFGDRLSFGGPFHGVVALIVVVVVMLAVEVALVKLYRSMG